MKLTRSSRPFADPEKAARRLMEHARAFKPQKDGRIYIEMIAHPFLYIDKGTVAEHNAGLDFAFSQGWIELHESGTYIRFTQTGNDLFA
jgi:hypothetical protein